MIYIYTHSLVNEDVRKLINNSAHTSLLIVKLADKKELIILNTVVYTLHGTLVLSFRDVSKSRLRE